MFEKKSPLEVFIGIILIFFVVVPITAIIESATAVQLWEWFLVDEYGKSPSYGAWFGLTSILTILTLTFKKEVPKIEGGIVAYVISIILICAVSCLAILGSAAIVQAMFGW